VRARLATAFGAILAACFQVQSAYAHHAFTSLYDCYAPVVLHGKVSSIEWSNPHVWIHLTADDGKVWMVEGGTPNTLLRMGVRKDMLEPGTAVSIHAYRTRNKACAESPDTHIATCRADGRSLTLGGGAPLFIGASGTGAPVDGADPQYPAGGAKVVEEMQWGKVGDLACPNNSIIGPPR